MHIVQYFDQFWVDINPIDLWRLGNATHGRLNHLSFQTTSARIKSSMLMAV